MKLSFFEFFSVEGKTHNSCKPENIISPGRNPKTIGSLAEGSLGVFELSTGSPGLVFGIYVAFSKKIGVTQKFESK